MSEEPKKPTKQPIVRPPGVRGRPGIDWGLMFEEWLESKLSVHDFLCEYGLKPSNPAVRKATRFWEENVKGAKHQHRMLKHQGHLTKPIEAIAEIWQTVQQWRQQQAHSDYTTANALRQHIKLLLNNAIDTNKDGQQYTKLKAFELRHLTGALLDIQKIQRLALGMSTENIGLPESGIEHGDEMANVTPDQEDNPIFVVEINKNGKFVRPKPRQLPAEGAEHDRG